MIKIKIKMINKNENENKNENANDNLSNIDIEGIRTVFFYERYFKGKKHKQKHLSNIQPNISISKKTSK